MRAIAVKHSEQRGDKRITGVVRKKIISDIRVGMIRVSLLLIKAGLVP